MARFYDNSDRDFDKDIEGTPPRTMTSISRGALWRFWLSAMGILCLCMVLYYISRNITLPSITVTTASISGAGALVLLLVMNQALRKMRLVSPAEAQLDKRIEKMLEQLDDRFSVFNLVPVQDYIIDHIIIGPSGSYVVKTTASDNRNDWEVSGAVEDVLEWTKAAQDLFERLLPDTSLLLEPVVTVADGNTSRVEQENGGVWIVNANKIAVSLLKRSGEAGSITHNVTETGAFSSNTLHAAAMEQVLAGHLNRTVRKTRVDYEPPPHLTSD